MDVTPADFPEIRWHGHWIWTEAPPIGSPFVWDRAPRPEAHGLFRRSFDLDAVPERVPARITADSRYVLWVNGQRLGHGPARSQPRRLSYDLYDLAPHLQAGQNLIAVQVKYHGSPKSDWAPAVANATLGKTGVLVFEADLAGVWLVSDASWKARAGRGWKTDAIDPHLPLVVAGVPVESFDARDETEDWLQALHDDGDWASAQVITPVHIGGRGRSQPPADPYGSLIPRGAAMPGGAICRPVTAAVHAVSGPDLTPPGPAERIERCLREAPPPRAVAQGGPLQPGAQVLRLDMGRIVAGFVDFAVQAPTGTIFEFHFTEEPLGAPGPFGAHGGSRYVARGHGDRHRIFDRKGFRYAYVLAHGTAGPVRLIDFAVQEDLYPWTGDAQFDCSDPGLTRLYHAGRRTVQLNSWDAFIDCPTREQRAWTGDAVVHQMVHLATNADWRLAGRYLDLANSPRPDGILPMSVAGDVEAGEGFTIPDWSLHWVHGLWNWYRFTGDRAAVKALMPSAERVLRWYLPYLNRAGRLQDVVEWNLVDWSSLYSEAESAIVTALWARALREFAEMAGWLGEAGSQAWAEALLVRVSAGFELFWDEARGTYVDHAVAGVAKAPVNQLAGALAVVSGLAPRDRWARIVAAITDPARLVVRSWMFPGQGASPEEAGLRFRRMTLGGLVPDWEVGTEVVLAEPFMAYVVHDAVAAAGRADLLPGLLRRWDDFLTDGYDTFGENWGTGTRVHGWSSTPVKDLVFHVLGVTPAKPGYAMARVAPRLGALDWVRGRVPCPQGMIAVEVAGGRVAVDSPVPVLLDLPGHPPRNLAAGRHDIAM